MLGIVLSLTDPQSFSAAQSVWKERIEIFGVLAPLAFILIQALQVVITPISHYSIGIIGGFLYGPYLGGFLNWTGRIIGHITAFFIARFAGREIAEKFVNVQTLHKYDKYVSDKSLILFLCYFLPIFPDDEMSYLSGLSKMKFSQFFLANIFGHIGGSLGLAYIGSGINYKDTLFWILSITSFVVFLLFWVLMKKKSS